MAGQVIIDDSDARVLLGSRMYLEGPRWRDGALYVSDVRADEVLRVQLDGTATVVASRPGLYPSGLGWTLDGRLIIVSVFDKQLLAVDGDGRLTVFADLAPPATSFTNDMAVDAFGHAYIGQAGSNIAGGEAVLPAPLLRVDPDGTVHDVGGELLCGNGIVITDGGRTLVVAETFGDKLTAFDIDSQGALSNGRVWADLPQGYAPDGICLDVEGAVWAACPFVQKFVRVQEGGTITDEISVPGRNAIACTLGGPDGTTLFMVTWTPTADSPAAATERTARVELAEVAVAASGQP